MNEPKEKDLRVWHIPQVPMDAFHVPVDSPEEAVKILDVLAQYDIFQYENRVKPDYSNAGGLEEFHCGEWLEWEHLEHCCDIDEYAEILDEDGLGK